MQSMRRAKWMEGRMWFNQENYSLGYTETCIGFVWEVRLWRMKGQLRCSDAQGKWPDLLPGKPQHVKPSYVLAAVNITISERMKKSENLAQGQMVWKRAELRECSSSLSLFLPLSAGLSGPTHSGSRLPLPSWASPQFTLGSFKG